MPCITNITHSDMARHFEFLLCKACKLLTKKQIESLLNPNGGIQDGLEWYVNHLWLDCTHKEDIFGSDKGESAFALKELKRMGYEIQEVDGGTQLGEINPKDKAYPY